MAGKSSFFGIGLTRCLGFRSRGLLRMHALAIIRSDDRKRGLSHGLSLFVHADWRAAGLLKPSAVKPVITTVAQNLVRKSLGTLSTHDQQRLREMLVRIVG